MKKKTMSDNMYTFSFSEWCILGSSHVCALPSLLRFLRFIRCHTYLPKMDHLFILHQIRFRRYSTCHLRIRQTEIGMSRQALSLQKTFDDARRIGHGQSQLPNRYRGFSCNILRFEDSSLSVFEMEIKI